MGELPFQDRRSGCHSISAFTLSIKRCWGAAGGFGGGRLKGVLQRRRGGKETAGEEVRFHIILNFCIGQRS